MKNITKKHAGGRGLQEDGDDAGDGTLMTLPECVLDQFEHLFSNDSIVDQFNKSSPEIINCCTDYNDFENENGVWSPAIIALSIAAICTFMLLVICLMAKTVSSNPFNKRRSQ